MTAVSDWRETIDRWFDDREPHQVRGPFTRWPRSSDAVLALVVFAFSLVAVAASATEDGEDVTLEAIGDQPAGAVILLAIAAGSLWWRRARPGETMLTILGASVAWAVFSFGDGHDAASVVAVYSVGRHVAEPRRSAGLMAALAIVNVAGTVVDSAQRIDVAPAIVLAFVPWYVGRRVRNRGEYLALLSERAERLEAERQAAVEQAEAHERTRIARELHDIVAHQVSMMTVQAGAAKTVARDDLDGAIEAMEDIEQAGRATLGELRHLLGALRSTADTTAGLVPQPGLAEIPDLVDELRGTGATVQCTGTDDAIELSAAHELALYRIIQEALTNVVKHAGPEPEVEVRLERDTDAVQVTIANTVSGPVSASNDPGFGLTGMRERVTLLGGELEAGPAGSGRFLMRARVPIGDRR